MENEERAKVLILTAVALKDMAQAAEGADSAPARNGEKGGYGRIKFYH